MIKRLQKEDNLFITEYLYIKDPIVYEEIDYYSQFYNYSRVLLLSKKGDTIAQGHISIYRVESKHNTADRFTKALAKDQFRIFIQ
ncbi:uncharacterized protein N7500_006536 [Penicillium coprophilum]|uniref:uncharacterized protein n=1 Tax=Penicillium coprophilum TaxID=36646 RepID=UPI0023A4EC2F|nr:uncharacterized protein N7500_006536 [Penicillium coprophilum]KAJ5164706.1 hypothetical protein N7500_006536 [Penicillium coprophilum]